MSLDITMCKGGQCPFKNDCHRHKEFNVQRKRVFQETFVNPPYKYDKGKYSCEMFWGEQSLLLYNQIKNIFFK